MNLSSFVLIPHDNKNKLHQEYVKAFELDADFLDYVGEFSMLNEHVILSKKAGYASEIYWVFKDNTIIGMFANIFKKGRPYLIGAIFSCFRGCNYATRLLEEYATYFFQHNKGYDELRVNIIPDNISSIKAALKANFSKIDTYTYVKKR